MSRLADLRTLLLAHPEITGSDEEVAAAVNAPTQAGTQRISTRAVRMWGAANGVLARFYAAAAGSDLAAAEAKSALLLVESVEDWDPADPAFPAVVGRIMGAGLLTEAEAAQLAAMGVATVRTVDVLGIGTVSPDDCARATRGWVEGA